MLSKDEILQTIHMIDQQHLDIRTITMGISLLELRQPGCQGLPARTSTTRSARKAEHLVSTGEAIEREFGIPIVNKRVCVTPISLVAAGRDDRGLRPLRPGAGSGGSRRPGVNFLGGFSALVQKGVHRGR